MITTLKHRKLLTKDRRGSPKVYLPISEYWGCIKRGDEKEAPRFIVWKTSCPNCLVSTQQHYYLYTSAKMGGGLCGNLLFIWISHTKTWQVAQACDFNAWKYKHGVKSVTAGVPAQFWTYFIGTVKLDRWDLTSWQTTETGMLWVRTGKLMKKGMLVQCNGLNEYTDKLMVKNSDFAPAQNILYLYFMHISNREQVLVTSSGLPLRIF